MIYLIDNYDSFTYNLYQYLSEFDTVKVVRNDQFTIEELRQEQPDAIVLSPGPGHPADAGKCIEVIQSFKKDIPIIGICLGHQAIGAAFGAEIIRAEHILHGKESVLIHDDPNLFGEEEGLSVMRYHSLVIDKNSLPEELEIKAVSSGDEEIMAVKHREHPIIGLQFHPESIGTLTGKQMLKNCLALLNAI
ncbi:aminodeoxychorismate/anthranilate synthase component II [Jeotgalibacillus sp. R-1-5s-1]|uniref:anthranilate synthase component II n=1 Tax=Jeotgalibacillus sp. R-1-5s-1 TaxID=2555897 RepID=UPI00106C99CA|nr:aminodeoxychorismate/anthranilate synthase component II [Jeotgalibacillus sp. R-1-5s-1]TFE03310.1 aminodeoxychorismate/anthranilate synthase component II [Jeotgalibacillus sp. R-1-5s-1]